MLLAVSEKKVSDNIFTQTHARKHACACTCSNTHKKRHAPETDQRSSHRTITVSQQLSKHLSSCLFSALLLFSKLQNVKYISNAKLVCLRRFLFRVAGVNSRLHNTSSHITTFCTTCQRY